MQGFILIVLVQIRPFSQPRTGVPLDILMSNTREGSRDIYTPTSTMLAGGVSPQHIRTPISNTHATPYFTEYYSY